MNQRRTNVVARWKKRVLSLPSCGGVTQIKLDGTLWRENTRRDGWPLAPQGANQWVGRSAARFSSNVVRGTQSAPPFHARRAPCRHMTTARAPRMVRKFVRKLASAIRFWRAFLQRCGPTTRSWLRSKRRYIYILYIFYIWAELQRGLS